MASFNYTTVDGDRIDLLAAKFYGSMDGIAIISDANPLIPLTAVFPLGTVLVIPIVAALARQAVEDAWGEYEEQLRSLGVGTARAVRNASLDDLRKAPGVSAAMAQAVYDFYHG